ncbi:hypothetical protein D9M72_209260 [compost metagenome]
MGRGKKVSDYKFAREGDAGAARYPAAPSASARGFIAHAAAGAMPRRSASSDGGACILVPVVISYHHSGFEQLVLTPKAWTLLERLSLESAPLSRLDTGR